jgi:two-component system, OmpR family, response regulator
MYSPLHPEPPPMPSSSRPLRTSLRQNLDHVLIADPDIENDHGLIRFLADHDICVVSARGHDDIARQIAVGRIDLVLLGLTCRYEDGIGLLRTIRSHSTVPVILLAHPAAEEADRVVGLELGADDCITKPVGMRELLARARAVLRRYALSASMRKPDPIADGLAFEGWHLQRRVRRLTNPAGTQVPLTKGEFALLLPFLDAPGRSLSREHLLRATRVREDVFDRSIDVQVMRLRRKLEPDAGTHPTILTERGVGYRFAPQVQPSQIRQAGR